GPGPAAPRRSPLGRKPCRHGEAAPGAWTRGQAAAVDRRPLAHTDQAVPAAASVWSGVRRPVVDDLEVDSVPAERDPNRDACRRRVLERVRERLLDDAVGGEVDPGGQCSALAGDLDVDLETRP